MSITSDNATRFDMRRTLIAGHRAPYKYDRTSEHQIDNHALSIRTTPGRDVNAAITVTSSAARRALRSSGVALRFCRFRARRLVWRRVDVDVVRGEQFLCDALLIRIEDRERAM